MRSPIHNIIVHGWVWARERLCTCHKLFGDFKPRVREREPGSTNNRNTLLFKHTEKRTNMLKGSYDAISSLAFSLECYKLFVHR